MGFMAEFALLSVAGEQLALIKGATCISEVRQRAAEAMSATVDEIKLSSKEGKLLDDSEDASGLTELVTAVCAPVESAVLGLKASVSEHLQEQSFDSPMGQVLRTGRRGLANDVAEAEWLDAFKRMDKNGDGIISRKEWAVYGGDNAIFDQIAGGNGSGPRTHISTQDWQHAFTACVQNPAAAPV